VAAVEEGPDVAGSRGSAVAIDPPGRPTATEAMDNTRTMISRRGDEHTREHIAAPDCATPPTYEATRRCNPTPLPRICCEATNTIHTPDP
jgi:hypothetical protein